MRDAPYAYPTVMKREQNSRFGLQNRLSNKASSEPKTCSPLPGCQCGFQPRDILLLMALEAGVWAFVGPKSFNRLNLRSVIDLVGSRTKEQTVHDGRHMTRNTATGF